MNAPKMVTVSAESLRKAMIYMRMKQDDVRAVTSEYPGYEKAHQLDVGIEKLKMEFSKLL